MFPIQSVDVSLSRDGELRGVLSAESGHTAGRGEVQEEDLWDAVFPEGSLCHLLPWTSCAFTSGEEEMNKDEK